MALSLNKPTYIEMPRGTTGHVPGRPIRLVLLGAIAFVGVSLSAASSVPTGRVLSRLDSVIHTPGDHDRARDAFFVALGCRFLFGLLVPLGVGFGVGVILGCFHRHNFEGAISRIGRLIWVTFVTGTLVVGGFRSWFPGRTIEYLLGYQILVVNLIPASVWIWLLCLSFLSLGVFTGPGGIFLGMELGRRLVK
jgi:hypothetical protein